MKTKSKLWMWVLSVLIFLSSCGTSPSQEANETSEEIVETEEEEQKKTPEITTNTCSICNREFEGRGYDEISEGVWKPCQEPYQCFICSPSCGMVHTREMNSLVEEAERIGSQSRGNSIRNNQLIYEDQPCSLCKGTGIEKNTAQGVFGGPEGRRCPMCDGRGVRSY